MPVGLNMAAALFRVMRTGSCMFRASTRVLAHPARTCSSSTELQQDEKVPNWVNSPVDQKIFEAETVEILFNSFEEKSLSVGQATNVITALAKIASLNPQKADDAFKDQKFKNVCNIIDKDMRLLTSKSLLSTLRSLLTIGVPMEQRMLDSMETEVLWKIRKLSMHQMVFLLSFHVDFQENDIQKKVVAEVKEKIQQRWFEISVPRDIMALLKLSEHFNTEFKNRLEDRTIELMNKMSVEDQQKIFTVLAEQKLRPTHLLRVLAFHIAKHEQKLSIKQMTNVVHAMSSLNFPDTVLLQRISSDILPELGSITKSSIVASFLTAFGQLKWGDTALLEAFTEWFQKNIDQCRIQDLVSYVLALAHVNFLPLQSDVLFPMLLSRLTQDSVGSDAVWIDVVWALVVLKKATPGHYASVLTPEFYQKLKGLPEHKSVATQQKLLTIDAVAILELPNYNSLLTATVSLDSSLPLTLKGDQTLHNSVIDTLSNYVPKGKYLTCNKPVFSNTYIDAEFVLDKELKPVSLEAQGKSNKLHRVALLIMDFKDFTMNAERINGQNALLVRILQNMGYVVVQIPYTEYNCQEPTVKRLQYLQQKIQGTVNDAKSSIKTKAKQIKVKSLLSRKI